MPSNIEKKLKETARTNPLTKAEKNTLWANIEGNINKINDFKPSIFVNLSPKFIFALSMTIAVIGASAATVAASNDAGPGDLLYPIDLAIERVQIALSKEKNKDNLRLKFAQERLKEAQRVLTFQNDDNSESVTISTSTKNNLKRIRKAGKALPVVLERLEKTKELLEKKGNEKGVEHINEMIEKLTELAENHISDLDDFEMEIENENEGKLEIKNYRNKIKVKFKLNHSRNKEKTVICHIPPDNPGNAHTIKIAQPAVRAHLSHGDNLGACDSGDQNDDDDNDNDNNSTSTPDITAPIISNISLSVSTNTADISWDTDEQSDSVVWYSTTTPLIVSNNTLFVDSSTLVTTHNISLSNLNSSTTYYFIVSSIDPSGNKATSTESSFITLTPDTTAPIISNISLSVSTNTADISWDTDEQSDSVVWYSTTTPLIVSNNTLFVDSSNLVINHTISLSNLNSSTTYYFIVSSIDPSGNKATSTESSFITL